MSNFATSWTVACEAPLSVNSPGKKLEWAAVSSSRGSSQPGIKPSLPHRMQIVYYLSHWGSSSLVPGNRPPSKWSVTGPKIREILFRINWWKKFAKPFGLKIVYSLSNRLMRNIITARAGASPKCGSVEQCQHAQCISLWNKEKTNWSLVKPYLTIRIFKDP